MKPFIVVGDKTSHGGVVVEGSPTNDIDGKGIARVGDKVTCPKKGCHSPTTIVVSGDVTITIDGKPVALHGDKTACGATLISTQFSTNSDSMGGGNSSAGAAAASGAAGGALATFEQTTHDLHFLVQDEMTGRALANIPYKITLANGRSVEGKTDERGLTEKISDNSSTLATIEAPYYGNSSSSSSNTNSGHEACGC